MIRPSLASIMLLAPALAAFAAPIESDPGAKQLQVYPKNLARHHVGANLFIFDTASTSYRPTEASAAWLDDDITTGWAAMAGKQHYLLALPEPDVITNFCLSARAAQGTITIFAGDEPGAPDAKSWVPLVRDVPFDSVNEKKLARPFSRLGKYILIETNIAEPGPIYSLYLFGERPAVAYQLIKRDQPIDVKALFGSFVNEQTAFSRAALYAGGRVAFATGGSSYTAWQKLIDENPESSVSIVPTKDEAGLVLKLADKQTMTRIAVLANSGAKGKLEVFLAADLPAQGDVAATAPADGVQPVRNVSNAPITQPISLAGQTPVATFAFDGSNGRLSQDLAGGDGAALLVRWTPDNGSDALTLREFNAFSGFSLGEYGLQLTPEAIAELARDSDGKSLADGKDGKSLAPVKELLPPIGQGFNRKPPYLPPALGFPPPIPPRLPPPVSE
ncbi:MAG: hypothetical protein ABMA13_21225 [Chthoniobacteraceae bacterium]